MRMIAQIHPAPNEANQLLLFSRGAPVTVEPISEVRNPVPRIFVVWDPREELVLGVADRIEKAERIQQKYGADMRISHVPKQQFLKAFFADEGIPILKKAE